MHLMTTRTKNLVAAAEKVMLADPFLDDQEQARMIARTGAARAFRRASGLTQVEIGNAIGVAPSSVALWESGNRRPHGVRAVRWVRLLREIDPELFALVVERHSS